jgi:hypothetical protein
MQDAAKEKLNDYRADFGAFLESATEENIGADAVAEELQVHVDSLLVAVRLDPRGQPRGVPEPA